MLKDLNPKSETLTTAYSDRPDLPLVDIDKAGNNEREELTGGL